MMMNISLLALPVLVTALTIPDLETTINKQQKSCVETIASIPGRKFENLAVRFNGNIIMVEAGPKPGLYLVDPFDPTKQPIVVTKFQNISLATGIVESQGEPDVFYINGGNNIFPTSPGLMPAPRGTSGIYRVDMKPFMATENGTIVDPVSAQHFATIQDAKLLNGLASIGHYLLAADSFAGVVWRVDTRDGSTSLAVNHTTMRPTKKGRAGINGVKVMGNHLYYDNTETSTIYSMAISADGLTVAPPHVIATNISCDDLLLDSEENVYVAGPANVITQIDRSSRRLTAIAGTPNSNSSALIGPTALAWGRTTEDEGSVYITTNGGFATFVADATGLFKLNVAEYL